MGNKICKNCGWTLTFDIVSDFEWRINFFRSISTVQQLELCVQRNSKTLNLGMGDCNYGILPCIWCKNIKWKSISWKSIKLRILNFKFWFRKRRTNIFSFGAAVKNKSNWSLQFHRCLIRPCNYRLIYFIKRPDDETHLFWNIL